MEEYYPKYLKDFCDNICKRCNNEISIKRILAYSYLNECNKCQNMGTYGYLNDYYKEHGRMPRSLYETCTCKKEYIYRTKKTCTNCSKCDKCLNNLSYEELDIINNINDKHLCKNCI